MTSFLRFYSYNKNKIILHHTEMIFLGIDVKITFKPVVMRQKPPCWTRKKLYCESNVRIIF